eukprot:1322749-Prymnesium_polylepis.1
MRRRWSGRLWGSRSVTAESCKGDHIFASARAHVAVHLRTKQIARASAQSTTVLVRSQRAHPVVHSEHTRTVNRLPPRGSPSRH